MTLIRITTVILAAVSLVTGGALAQEKGGGAAAPAGAVGGGTLRHTEGAPGSAGAARPASPGMAPSGSAQPAPGARNAGENAGESPVQKPSAPGEAAGQNKPDPAVEGQSASGKGEANGQTGAKPGQEDKTQAGAGRAKGGARPAPKVTEVQQTRIRQSFKTIDVHPVNVTFNVGVGVAVPASIALRPLPPTIIDVVPDYEGYRFFVVPGQIVIVDPDSLEVVDVLPL